MTTTPGPHEDRTSMTLLDRLRERDHGAWNRTVTLYRPLILYWCRRGGIGVDDAEDVAQEVFRAVAADILAFRRDQPGDTFRGWLRGMTHFKVLDWHRYRGRQPAGAVGGTEAGRALHEVADVDDDDPAEVSGLYHRALELVRGEFEAKTWAAFWRVAVDGLATADVARELGVSSAVVRQAKSRVLRRLKEEIGDLIA